MMNQIRVTFAALCAVVVACPSFAVQVVPENFSHKVALSLSDDAKATLGEGALTDFPIPVRLSTDIVNFTYSDFRCAGEDIAFADEEGNALEFELDTWNTSGESLYWVKVPSLNAATALTCYYGAQTATVHDPKLVWTSYAAVIHGGPSLKDSSTNQLAVAANATTLTDSAVVGGGIAKAENKSIGVNLANPYNVLKAYNKFSILGWYKRDGNGGKNNGTHVIAGARNSFGAAGGFLVLQEQSKYISVAAQSSHQWSSGKYTFADKVWGHFAFTYEQGGKLISYFNGAKDQEKSSPGQMYATTSQAANWTFGSYANAATEDSFKGEMDEIRVYDGVASALWVTNEYAFSADATRVCAGEAKPLDETAFKFEAAPSAVKSANGFAVSVKVVAGQGALYAVYGAEYPFANTNLVASSVTVGETYSLELTDLPANANVGFGVIGVSTSGNVREELAASAIMTGEIAVAKGADADEGRPNTPGYFTVTRPTSATVGDTVVAYTLGGTAVAGTHYVALSGSVTIPDGEASAQIDVYPIAACQGDHTLTLTLAAGPYGVAAPGTASLVVKGFRAESGFAKKIVFTASGYAGSETLTDFPMLVRLSTAIEDFDYADFRLANGGDIRFATEDGEPLVHEVDSWNTDGESFVWVKVPTLTKDTKVIAYYGNSDPWSVSAAEVWNGYVGVWHMNGGSGSETDVTGHGLTGTPTGSKLTEMVADDNAPIGLGRVNQSTAGKFNRLSVPNYNDYITDQSVFTLSGWFKMKTASGYQRPLSRKTKYDEGTGWEIQYNNNSKTQFEMRGSSATQVTVDGPDATASWEYLTFVFNGTTGTAYANGVQKKSGTIAKVASRTDAMAIGNNSSGSEQGWCGSYDEVRLYNGVLSADRIAADYATVTDAAFAVSSEVQPVDASAVKFATKPAVTENDGTFTVHVTTATDSGEGSITAVYTADGETELTDLMTSTAGASSDYQVALTQLAADTSYRAGVRGENAKGSITKANADGALYNGVPELTKTRDADEASLGNPGIFTVTRADTYGDLVINYTTGGDAVAGTDYEELPGTITIPDGKTNATIEVHVLRTKTTDHTLTLTLAHGLYLLDSTSPSATMTIKTLVTPTGCNTWIADADGDASVAANWSEGRVPQTTDNIVVDGRFSNASMTWDAGVNGLPSTVASWTQSFQPGDAEYTGTVTFKTVYPGKGDFTCFTVTGACVIDCGTWTHPQSRTMGDIHNAEWDWLADLKANETYRLRLDCGSLAVGPHAALDVKMKGYYASHNDSRCYASHGGTTRAAANVYDDPKEPIHVGMAHRVAGNHYNGKGGGAVYVTVSGDAVVNGAICADSGNTGYGAGAAGSVYLKAKTLTGTGSITAKGSATGEGNYKGTGGRIAIITETAVNRSTFAAISAESEWKNAQNGQATEYGGCGTVFFKDSTMSNGKLVIAPKSDLVLNWANSYRMTIVGTDGDWTFDAIEFGRNGFLIIPAGTTLRLPDGLASCSGTASSSSVAGGIYYDGGTLDLGPAANQTMSGNWMIFANSNLTINANVTVTGGAVIGVPEYGNIMEESATLPTFPACKVTVNGNLTIDATGKLKAEKCGFRKSWNNTEKGLTGYDTHGGRTMAFGKTLKLHYLGYDSIFNPRLPGCTAPQTNGQGVGNTASVLDFTVTGTLTVNGPISATAIYEGPATHNEGAGPGGSIKITAGALAGSGSISADGACNSGSACGGGGRIAVRLTNPGATFAGFSGAIIASGRLSSATALNNSSSAGTVYLQTAAEGEKCGTIRIANRLANTYYSAANSNTTEMASLGYGGDAVVDYKYAKYVVADYGRAAVNTNMQAASVFLADATAHLDLEGHALKVKSFKYVTKDGDVVTTNKLSSGIYTFADLSAIANLNVDDSSEGDTGSILVTGGGMAVIIR